MQVVRRLQLLYHHGYLDRPRCQLDFYHRGGSQSMVYGLGSRGVAMLRRDEDIPFSRMVWGRGGQDVGRVFLEHTLMVAEICIAMQKACEALTEVKFVAPEELETKQRGREAFAWRLNLKGRQVGLVPDVVVALDHSKEGGVMERLIVCVEADRGTMPVLRRSSHLSSIGKKLECYAELWKAGHFEKRFGTKRIVVLIVTTSEARVKSIEAAVSKLTHGRGLFTCCTEEALTKDAGSVLARWLPQTSRRWDK